MLYREWNVHETDEEKSIALAKWLVEHGDVRGNGRLLANVLQARGINTSDDVKATFDNVASLPDPFLIEDMDKAVSRIHRAIETGESIVIFGDYDVDGIASTALVYSYLEEQGANVYYKLASRADKDYGLSAALVDDMAERGIGLIITVDNGTTAFEAALRAAQLGISLVITDHHLPYDTLPKADAVVNPCRPDDQSGLAGLSGSGVAFMLISALEGCSADEMLPLFGDFAALGTVADVMKLVGENRIIVRHGLKAMQDTVRPGLRALIDTCVSQGKQLAAESISYGIAPRLNAAGRMHNATVALELLLAESEEQAMPIVNELQEQNAARQKAEQEILEIVHSQIEHTPQLQRARVLVIWGEGWHQGVIGIVASRLVDRYAKPAIVIAFDGEEGKGSGRSVAGFSLHGSVASCEDILIRYGGHDLAAGFSIHKDHVEEFRRRVNQWAIENNPMQASPKIRVDAIVSLQDISVEDVDALSYMAPCGSGNPVPRFLIQNATIDAVYSVSEGRHSRLRLSQGGVCMYAVLFGTGPEKLAYAVGNVVDVLVNLSVYSGKQGPQLSARIIELRPAGLDNEHVAQSALFASFMAGAKLQEEQKGVLAANRDDIAAVYRDVRASGRVPAADLRPLFARIDAQSCGKVLTALAALEELGLIEQDTNCNCYVAPKVQGKKDLASSQLLQQLGSVEAAST